MKWKDLSLKERKQIYDSVRVNNPGATYFDIKRQFDSIPEYEDGKDNSVAAVYSLPEVNVYPQNRFGDIARSQGYETAKNWKKVKEGTTAGINTFINSPHAQFVQTMLPLPDGLEHLGSGIKQVKQFIKSESDRYARNVYNNLMPMSYYSSYTGKNKLNEVKEAVKDYIKGKDPKDLNNPKWKEEAYKIFEDDYKRNPNRDSSFEMEPNMAIEQAIFPDERTRELVENVDKTYGTNYKRAYSNIAYKDMTKRGSYVKWGNTDKDGYGQINIKNIKDNVLPTDINDYNIILDNNIYMPGTANHELGHVADGLAGSRKIQDFDSGKEYITNTYLNYLANSNNTYSSAELRKMGLFDAAGSRSYLLNPTEAKSHMLTLKRSLKDSGKITNWSTPVDENMILEYMRNPTSNKMVKNQYDLYRNKNEYIDRLNKLIPMEILMPLGGAGFVGHELNKE